MTLTNQDPMHMAVVDELLQPGFGLAERKEVIAAIQARLDKAVVEARIAGIKEAHKKILEIAYTYVGEGEMSDFCGVDDLSRVAMSWMVDSIKSLKSSLEKGSE